MTMRFRSFAYLMSAVLLLALAVGPAFAGNWFNGHKKGVEGSGDLETRTLDLDDFDAIELNGGFDLQVSFGSQQSVKVTIDDNLWDIFVAEVNGDELVLEWDKSCRPSNKCKIVVVAKSLEQFDLNGAGDIEIAGFDGKRLAFNLRGAGDIDISGEVDDLEVMVAGAGDVDTKDLKAKNVEVKISGVGDAKVYASESIDARISGVGDITYYGSPSDRNTRVSGMGDIRSR